MAFDVGQCWAVEFQSERVEHHAGVGFGTDVEGIVGVIKLFLP